MEHTTIAVDLAKSVFQVAVSHRPGRVDEERRLSRDRFLPFFAQRPPATIVLEACGSAHYWARQLQPFGHSVRLLPPHDVRPHPRRAPHAVGGGRASPGQTIAGRLPSARARNPPPGSVGRDWPGTSARVAMAVADAA